MIELPTTRDQIAFLHRRAGWGLRPGELDGLVEGGTEAALERLVDPDGAGVAPETGPWDGWSFDYDRSDNQGTAEQVIEALDRWVDALLNSERPLEHQLAWFWHDHFAVSAQVVKHLPTMLNHLDLCRTLGVGDFAELIHAVTIDAAMLVFLDGTTSVAGAPNENYGRELLELYTVGINNFTEDDVLAAAIALTGWVARPRFDFEVRFVPTRHDDTPQTLLGVDDVHDVASVVAATTGHPACPVFIASKLGRALLGDIDNPKIFELGEVFSDAGLDIMTLTRATLTAGLDGHGSPQVQAPLPWLVQAFKTTGVPVVARTMAGLLRSMGQVPGRPPNVGGYPGAATWLASSATAARFSAANFLARNTADDAAVLVAARAGDWDEVADLCLRPQGFSAATVTALRDLPASTSERPGEAALALALASPDVLIA